MGNTLWPAKKYKNKQKKAFLATKCFHTFYKDSGKDLKQEFWMVTLGTVS